MRKILLGVIAFISLHVQLYAQSGNWKPWMISTANELHLPPPPPVKTELAEVLMRQQTLDAAGRKRILYWNAGSAGYRWQEMIGKLWMYDTAYTGALSNLVLGVATYDATVAAFDAKKTHNRLRPFAVDRRVNLVGLRPESSSYPCEQSVAAGVGATVIAHFYPALADSVARMAQEQMATRVAGGFAFPSDTKAGFELGKRMAEKAIERTKDFATKEAWDGRMPEQAGTWRGKKPMFPLAGRNKTFLLDSASQFRPGPPPEFGKEMAELKAFKQTFRSQSNAFFWASQDFWTETLNKKMFENNLHLDPLQSAYLYAANAAAAYDCFISCFDAKYAYWGIRPDQYDTTYRSLVPTPPFPGYPSGHAMMSGMYSELYAHFFPNDAAYFRKKAKDAAESRFQAGIHFRSDNEVGLDLGRKVASYVIRKMENENRKSPLLLAQKESKRQ